MTYPVFGFSKYFILVLIVTTIGVTNTYSQPVKLERGSPAFFDSLDNRIENLQKQIPRLKESRDVAYYNLKREIDLTQFVKACEELIREEDLDNAKKLVETRIERAEFRRDQFSLDFYQKYKGNLNAIIKQQRIHYQELFAKEKNFKKEFEKLAANGASDMYRKTMKMIGFALKYATENNLTETIKYLESYQSYTRALIFDAGSSFDLAVLTSQLKEFEKVFNPLVESDSVKDLKKAEVLLSHCINYAGLTGSKLTPEFFLKQGLVVSTSLSDLLEQEGREKDLARYTDESVKARFDTINPCGVFKWHDHVVVIDEFKPTSFMEAVKKGEAILHADKMLSAYLKKNKLCKSQDELKFGFTFVIPYQSNAEKSSFYYNTLSQKWQYIACYTSIVNEGYTQQVSKYMPPLLFENEKDLPEQSDLQLK